MVIQFFSGRGEPKGRDGQVGRYPDKGKKRERRKREDQPHRTWHVCRTRQKKGWGLAPAFRNFPDGVRSRSKKLRVSELIQGVAEKAGFAGHHRGSGMPFYRSDVRGDIRSF